MGDVINLRQARKRRVRAVAAEVADANRLRFGRTRAQRAADDLERDRSARLLDGARLGDDTDGD